VDTGYSAECSRRLSICRFEVSYFCSPVSLASNQAVTPTTSSAVQHIYTSLRFRDGYSSGLSTAAVQVAKINWLDRRRFSKSETSFLCPSHFYLLKGDREIRDTCKGHRTPSSVNAATCSARRKDLSQYE
jgi:hypothetical protein